MAYCIYCGKKLDEGARFCTYCGKQVSAPAAWKTGENTEKAQASSARLKLRSFKVGWADYRTLNNVTLVSKPSQHIMFHITAHLLDIIALIYILMVFFPVILPELTGAEGAKEITYAPGMFPGLSALFLIAVISGIIGRKIRYDIFRSLPKGFDYWKIKRVLQWEIFGFESIKTALLRLLGNTDLKYPELGFGTDEEGNYYAFTVSGDDTERYPFVSQSP